MPAKMTRSVPSAAVRAAGRAGSHPHLAWVLREGQKSARIHARSGVIWGIPAINPWAGMKLVRWWLI